MGDGALEAIGVSDDPIHHVAAVGSAHGADVAAVGEGIGGEHVVKATHQVDVRKAAPVSTDLVSELLPVADRAARIDHDYQISLGGEKFSVPAKGPGITPGALRAAVDEELDRIFLVCVEVRRFHQPSLHARLVAANEPE